MDNELYIKQQQEYFLFIIRQQQIIVDHYLNKPKEDVINMLKSVNIETINSFIDMYNSLGFCIDKNLDIYEQIYNSIQYVSNNLKSFNI